MHFGIGKSRDVTRHDETCRDVSRVSDTLVTTSASGTTRLSLQTRQARLSRHVFRGVVTAWTGVDMSISLFPEVVPEIDANREHKGLNLYTRARLDTLVTIHATRTTRCDVVHVMWCRYVAWRAKWNLGFIKEMMMIAMPTHKACNAANR